MHGMSVGAFAITRRQEYLLRYYTSTPENQTAMGDTTYFHGVRRACWFAIKLRTYTYNRLQTPTPEYNRRNAACIRKRG